VPQTAAVSGLLGSRTDERGAHLRFKDQKLAAIVIPAIGDGMFAKRIKEIAVTLA
jgi:hypothetical protein